MAVGIDVLTLIDPTVFEHQPMDRFLQQQVQQCIAQAIHAVYARGDWIVANGRPIRHDQIRFSVELEGSCINVVWWEHLPLTAEQQKLRALIKMPIAPPYSQRNDVTW